MNAKKNNILKIIYIILVYFQIATDRQRIYNVTYFSKYYIGIIIIVILFGYYIVNKGIKILINKKQLYVAELLILPIVCVFLHSMVLNVVNPVIYSGFVSRSFGLVVYGLLAIFQAYIVFVVFKESAVTYTFVGIVFNYLTSILVAFNTNGLKEFVNVLTDSHYSGSVLEMHELSPIAAMFFFYFLFELRFKNKSKRITIYKEFVCIVIIILSMKRIVILSSVVVVMIFEFIYFASKRNNNIMFSIRVISYSIITTSLLFVYLMKSNILFFVLSLLDVNTMSRIELWQGINTQYEFSFLFLGRGSGYVSKWMDNNWMYLEINGLNETIGLHSDILKTYIELGFIGFFIYLHYILIHVSAKLGKIIRPSASILYFLLIVLQILIWFTENVSIFHNYQWIMCLMIFSLIDNKKRIMNMRV